MLKEPRVDSPSGVLGNGLRIKAHCISAGHLGRFSGDFAFSDSHSFSPFSALKGLCALLLGSLAVLFFWFFALTAGGQEMSLSAAIILRGRSRHLCVAGCGLRICADSF